MGDYKQGHAVVGAALSAWGRAVATALADANMPPPSPKNVWQVLETAARQTMEYPADKVWQLVSFLSCLCRKTPLLPHGITIILPHLLLLFLLHSLPFPGMRVLRIALPHSTAAHLLLTLNPLLCVALILSFDFAHFHTFFLTYLHAFLITFFLGISTHLSLDYKLPLFFTSHAAKDLLVVMDDEWWTASALHIREQLRLFAGPHGPTSHPSARVRLLLVQMLSRLLLSCARFRQLCGVNKDDTLIAAIHSI